MSESKEEIIDMLTEVADCFKNEENTCPFYDECDCDEKTCKENWTNWLLL